MMQKIPSSTVFAAGSQVIMKMIVMSVFMLTPADAVAYSHSELYSPLEEQSILEIKQRFLTSNGGDWTSKWSGPERTLDSAFDTDPYDDRTTMRGSGKIILGGDHAVMKGSPRLYIAKLSDDLGWENIEMTAYGKYVAIGNDPRSYSGFTMTARSNHDNYMDDGCEAFGYYARIYQKSGKCAFQKEYYHSSYTVYSKSITVKCFEGGLPLNQWIGMKFKVTTLSSTDNVRLELFLDENNTGDWKLRHWYVDKPGSWLWSSSKTKPVPCERKNGDTVLGRRNVCYLRTDGGDKSTEVHWRDASIINSFSNTKTEAPTKKPSPLAPAPSPSPTKKPSPLVAPAPSPSPTKKPSPPAPAPSPKPSCISGEAGIINVDHDHHDFIKKVKHVQIGNKVRGFDSKMRPAICEVEAVGSFGYGPLHGNYTNGHYIFNTTSRKVEEHGKVGPEKVEERFDLIADCPLVEDETGTRFAAIDSDFCGGNMKELSWKDYVLLHSAILKVVRASGGFWFHGSSYKDMDMVKKYAPKVCKHMLKCVKNSKSCKKFERVSMKFINNALTQSVEEKVFKAFSNIGSRCKVGSVSAAVTSGKSVDESLIGTQSC